MGKEIVWVVRALLGTLAAIMGAAFLVKSTHPLLAGAGFAAYFAMALFVPSILFRPKPVVPEIGKGVFRYFVQVLVTADLVGQDRIGSSGPAAPVTLPTGSWFFREAGRKIRVFAALEIWGASTLLLWYFFGIGLAQVNQQIDHATYTFLNYMVPLGIGFAVSKGLTKSLRTRVQERIADRRKSEPPRKDVKLADVVDEEIMPSGYPWNFAHYRGTKSSRDLQTDFISRMNDRALSRFDRWTGERFSLSRVYGFGD
jgi:hypothetical protein